MFKVEKTALFQKWFGALKNEKLTASIKLKIERIEQEGYFGKTYPIKGFKNISEIKIEMGKGYRVYFHVYIQDNKIWFLNGGDKSTQSRDIEIAYELLQEIQKRREATK